MMDHRAEAEAWLRSAAAGETQPESIEFALIGIGHALLALSGPKAPITAVKVSGNPSKTELEALRAAIRQSPPLSPSEG